MLPAMAQNARIKGKVMDAAGNPVGDVSVSVKKGTTGTITKDDGSFTLPIADRSGVILVFSKTGFKPQEIRPGNDSLLTVSLADAANSLNSVVVIGYGKQSKRRVTGAIATVDMKQQEELPNTNILQAMRGRVAGVQFTDNGRPGQGGDVLVRGQRSITASNAPLIILDGVFFNGSLADINPSDIQSMDILKDASSSAIYGSRAANGVLLITTKSGKEGKPALHLNTYYAGNDWSHKMKLLSPQRYIQKTLDFRSQNGMTADPTQIDTYLTTSEAANHKAGKIVDPWDLISQTSSTASYDMNISGKNDKTSYFVSGSLVNEKGLILNDNSRRVSLRMNLENKVRSWLAFGITSQYTMRDLSGLEASPTQAYNTSPFSTLYFPDGQPQKYTMPEDQLTMNPLYLETLTTNQEMYHNLFANIYGTIDAPFLKGLSYRFNYAPGYRWQNNYNYQRQDVHLTVNNTTASKINQTNFDWTIEHILTYNHQINADNGFDVTLLYGQNHSEFDSTKATGATLPTDVVTWNNLVLAATQTNGSGAQSQDGVSSMARLNYRLKDRYFFTLTGRRDGSSVFSKNHKYAFFPSGAVAWVASDESFLKKVKALDLLKVRLSYGAVGNQAINPYQSLSLTTTTQYVFGDGSPTSTGLYAGNLANPNLKWETTYSGNLGFDFSLLNGRLGGTIEGYQMKTKDLLLNRAIPVANGFTNVLANLGETKNTGIEVTLNIVPVRTPSFEWTANLTFSANRNRIVHIYNSDANGDGKEDDDVANAWFIGKPVSVAYDYVQDGIYQQGDAMPAGYKPGWMRMKDEDGNKVIDANDRRVLGSLSPTRRWGINNTFHYKQFTLSAFVNSMQGWMAPFILLATSNGTNGNPNYPGRPANMLDAGWWTPDNKSNTRPSLNYTNPLGRNYYMSRDFVRLQDVSFSYELPARMFAKTGLTSARVYVSGRNLYTWTHWLGPDPESGQLYFPTPRSIAAGINLGL
jgi:TonB-linked SusC/RagA family outer membrane protein